jgi:hypothetical protein
MGEIRDREREEKMDKVIRKRRGEEPKIFLVPKGKARVVGDQKSEGTVSVSGVTKRLNFKGSTRQLMVERFGKSFQAVQILTTDEGPKRFWIRPSSLDAPEARSVYAEKSIGISNLPGILKMKISGVVEMTAEWDSTLSALLVHADKPKPSRAHQAVKRMRPEKAPGFTPGETPLSEDLGESVPRSSGAAHEPSLSDCMPSM